MNAAVLVVVFFFVLLESFLMPAGIAPIGAGAGLEPGRKPPEAEPVSVILILPPEGSFHAGDIMLWADVEGGDPAAAFDVLFQYSAAGSAQWKEIGRVGIRPYTKLWRPPGDGIFDVRVLAYDVEKNAGLDLASDLFFNSPPRITVVSPQPGSETSDRRPTVVFDVVDEGDGIDAASVVANVNGKRPSRTIDLCPIPGGFRGSLVPDQDLPPGTPVEVWLEAVDGQGIPAVTSFFFHESE